ncbi:NADH dehydrogenase transmembrane protein [Legionella santicrucis]|uniref:NADH:ubiquinone reductase (non-electrogenic) n=1 Tax=Legionella santicrucis TaxID=45074 RepID=A0A0W0YJI5_9GAMM|nr:FAD-dependent oxidoreductase [Legionella santicrucis]KTD56971.1 NADH dehydrogenase transmembrane protein [Legionella santicrucis]
MNALKQEKNSKSKYLVHKGAIFFTAISNVTLFLGQTAWPFFDFLFRFWIGNKILIAGLLQAHHWNISVLLATNEYPVPWLAPEYEAFLGIFVQLVGGGCLILGLFTRAGALMILILSVMTQIYYVKLDLNLLLITLMMGYVLRGPGPFSLDHLFEQGLSRIALPFAMSIHNFFNVTKRASDTIYLLGLRIWLMIICLLLGNYVLQITTSEMQLVSVWLPLHSFSLLINHPGIFILPLFLVLGAATRLIALLLLILICINQAHASELAYAPYWMMIMAILFVSGPGFFSFDQILLSFFKRRYPQLSGKPAFTLDNLPHVVIIGGGFGGIACAKALRHVPVKVTLVDKNNYHLFQPLLYQVATGNLSSGDIAVSIRSIFLDQFNAQVLLGTVTSIDKEKRLIITDQFQLSYDYLVIASGATHSYFGKDVWEPYAPGLKSIEDAIAVRSRIIQTFESAEIAETEVERQNLLNFVIVGGGPTGIELAGAIIELARYGMEKDFRHFDPGNANVILIQAAPRLLPAFSEKSSAKVQQSLEAIGVKVYTNSTVEHIDEMGVIVKGQRIYSKSVFWAAGVKASPAALWLDVPADNTGRVIVNNDFSVPNCNNIYVIGDTASANLWHGKPMPGLAPAAKQGGKFVAKKITAHVYNKSAPSSFNYTHLGSLATISRKASIVEFNRLSFYGELAWWFWGVIHVSFLVGARNKFSVLSNWIWSFFTFRANNLLITSVKTKK